MVQISIFRLNTTIIKYTRDIRGLYYKDIANIFKKYSIDTAFSPTYLKEIKYYFVLGREHSFRTITSSNAAFFPKIV